MESKELKQRSSYLAQDILWLLDEILPRVDEALLCGYLSREEQNRLTSLRSQAEKFTKFQKAPNSK